MKGLTPKFIGGAFALDMVKLQNGTGNSDAALRERTNANKRKITILTIQLKGI